jgi:intraflagellar transport protein 88
MELEIAKGITFLKRRSIREAIDVFKGFEKHDVASGVLDQAATNLSFLYFLEGDMKSSERYAELAVRTDRYNAKALVNKANYLFVKGELEQAKELFLEAIGVEADCVEAIYNLGLANKKLGAYKDSLQAFKKLHRIIPKDTQVLWHMANLHELLGDNLEAAQVFTTLHGMVPTDSKVLARLGTLYTKEDDETQAFHNFQDSFQAYPVNMEVISWLGVWYVKSGLYEDAIQYFERAAEIEPHEVKWQLMVASCYRRMNDYKQALALYKKIHKQDPENVECQCAAEWCDDD